MLTHECKGNASYKHLSIKQENIDLYYKNKSRIFATVPKLYNIKADYLLLFFYNPDCHACQEITRQMESSFLINEFSKSNKLKILAVYPDEDLDAWKEHVSVMPKDWINSYDKSVSLKNDEIYDLKAIPTLYLLNKEKKVLLKDATFQQIENYLSQTTN